MPEKNYTLHPGADALAVSQLLEDKIYHFNCTKIDKEDGQLFSKVLRNDQGEIVAGMAGWTWANACEITQLWVDEKTRGKGIGKMLLNAAEEEARNKCCLMILVKTYSFQAPEFYLKYGFEAVQIIKDFPPGYQYYTLVKTIE